MCIFLLQDWNVLVIIAHLEFQSLQEWLIACCSFLRVCRVFIISNCKRSLRIQFELKWKYKFMNVLRFHFIYHHIGIMKRNLPNIEIDGVMFFFP